MRRLPLGVLPASLLAAAVAGCSSSSPAAEGDGDADALPDAEPEAEPDAPEEDAAQGDAAEADSLPEGDDGGAPRPLRALLVDYDVLHPDAWIDLVDAFAAAGVAVDYRRFYPHLTAADTTGDDAYDVVVLASGLSPSTASAQMAAVEVDTAVAFVQSGGLLVLAPWPGHLDGASANNEWFLFNRVLETLAAPLRIEKALLVGDIFALDPDWPHTDSDLGYATSLEFDVGYAWLRPNPELPTAEGVGDRVAAGRSTTVRTSGGRVEVYTWAYLGQQLWRRLAGDQLLRLNEDHPAVVAAEVAPGHVAVIPKGLLTAGGANGMVSHQPVLQPAVLAANRVFLGNVVRRLADLRRGAAFEPNDPSPDERLFATAAPGWPPITESRETIEISSPPFRHALPEAPPPGDHLESAPEPDETPPAVPLFPLGTGTLGFGSVPGDPAQTDVRFAEAAAMGIDTLMLTITPEQLVTDDLTPEEKDALRARIADTADRAASAGVPWTVGMYYSGYVFLNHDDEWPWSVGAQGQRVHQPAVAYAPYWDEALSPAVVEVATIAAEHPGIAGIQIDMETYDGVLWYSDLQCFDDESFAVYLDALEDAGLRAELEDVGARGRMDALIDRGLLRDYLEALSAEVEAAGRRMEEAVHAIDPGFAFVLYAPIFSSAWFYRSLARGLATPGLPVVWLSYDTLTRRQRASWVGDGIPVVHLGGVIVGNFAPDGLRTALESGLAEADGFWFFSFDEVSDTAAADPPHGARADYRAAIAAAAER
jgi:hypothetical protein